MAGSMSVLYVERYSRWQKLEAKGVSGVGLEGMKCLYFLSQDLRCLVMSLITLHFKIKRYDIIVYVHTSVSEWDGAHVLLYASDLRVLYRDQVKGKSPTTNTRNTMNSILVLTLL